MRWGRWRSGLGEVIAAIVSDPVLLVPAIVTVAAALLLAVAVIVFGH